MCAPWSRMVLTVQVLPSSVHTSCACTACSACARALHVMPCQRLWPSQPPQLPARHLPSQPGSATWQLASIAARHQAAAAMHGHCRIVINGKAASSETELKTSCTPTPAFAPAFPYVCACRLQHLGACACACAWWARPLGQRWRARRRRCAGECPHACSNQHLAHSWRRALP